MSRCESCPVGFQCPGASSDTAKAKIPTILPWPKSTCPNGTYCLGGAASARVCEAGFECDGFTRNKCAELGDYCPEHILCYHRKPNFRIETHRRTDYSSIDLPTCDLRPADYFFLSTVILFSNSSEYDYTAYWNKSFRKWNDFWNGSSNPNGSVICNMKLKTRSTSSVQDIIKLISISTHSSYITYI